MSDITISVIQPPSTTINVGVDETTLIQAGMGLPPHSVTHISGGSDELNHNLLAGLQGGSNNQYYHLSSGEYFNLVTGQVIRPDQTGLFYLNSNPSGFITGIDLSSYATINYVSGTSGHLQSQITNLNNATGSYVLNSATGQFYSNSNPSGFITGIDNIVYTTGNQIISGAKTFTGSFNVSTHDPIIIRSTGYTHGIEIGGFYYNKIADGGFINEFGVGGTENHFGDSAASSNSFGGNANQNDFGSYATLNNYYGGSVIGELIFDTAPTFSSGEVRDQFVIGSLGATENADPTSLVLRSSLGYSIFSSVISRVGLDSANYNHNKITQTIDGEPTVLYNYYFPQANGTLALDSTAVMLQGNQTVNGIKNFTSIPIVNSTGVLLSGSSYITGISGDLQTQITTLNNQTGNFYPRTNPSGYITGISNLVFTTGNQTISGLKTFANNLTVNGNDLFVDTSNNRVGISTASPIATLDVNGSGLFRSGLFISGSRPTVNSTGVLLSGEATTQAYVTGISGGLQTQITTLNNQTGSYYLRTNPSGYITGVDLSFSGNYYTKTESESRYVKNTGTETILGNKTFSNDVYINRLFVTGSESIINTTNVNVQSNYIMLNLTGGAVDGGVFFVTGSGLTGVNDSGAIIGFDHSDKFKFGISTRASDLSTLSTIASVEQMTGISGGLQTQISTLNSQTGTYVFKTETGNFITNSQTGQFYPNSNPSGFITGIDLSSYATQVYVTGISGDLQAQITDLNNSTGQFYLNSNPSGYITGVNLSTYATINYTTGISGELQTQITNLFNATGSYVLNSQTGNFYPNSNPSGFITGISNIVFTTGDQTIAGNKTFSNNVTHNGLLKATAQNPLTGTVATDVITRSLLDSSFGEKGLCLYINTVAIGGNQTATQFAAQGSLSWGSTPVAGSSTFSNFAAPHITVNGNSVSNNTGGQGNLVDWRTNHAAVFPIAMPIGGGIARDIEIRVYFGSTSLSNSNTRLGALNTTNGYGIRITKHPVNNTYVARLVCRTTTAGTANITAATNASPIVITQNSHGLLTGDTVEILHVGGNTAANGVFTIQNVTTNTFELVGSTGNGAYTSGGSAQRITSSSIELNPGTSYIFCLRWTFATRTLSLHLNNLDQPAVLSIDRVGLPYDISVHQTTGIKIGFTSITDTTAFLSFSYGTPQMFKI